MPSRTPHRSKSWLAMAVLALSALTTADAAAQVGRPFTPLIVLTDVNAAMVGIYVGRDTIGEMTAAGGVTVFASMSPNGPLVASVPFLPPFNAPINELNPVYTWSFFGVPPGTYYVAIVLGVVQTPNVPNNAWAQVVVPGGCSGPPGTGMVTREVAGGPTAVRLQLAAWGGCSTSYLVEAGTTPGGTNVLSFEQPGGALTASNVPAGDYYVRVRGRNAQGLGGYSRVLPVSVPACPTVVVEETEDGPQASVAGNQVTISWTPDPAPPGGPITFYEAALFQPESPIESWPRVLLPTLATSITATLPPGLHRVAIVAGNRCGTWTVGVATFTIP